MTIEEIVKFIQQETGCDTCIHMEGRTDRESGNIIGWCHKYKSLTSDGKKCNEWAVSVFSSDIDVEVEAIFTQTLRVKESDNV